jgi:hypothetical protein
MQLELKLLGLSFDGTDKFRDVGDGAGTLAGYGVHPPDENDGAAGQLVLQNDLLAGKVVPIEVAFLHEENFVFIPAGYLHTAGIALQRVPPAGKRAVSGPWRELQLEGWKGVMCERRSGVFIRETEERDLCRCEA